MEGVQWNNHFKFAFFPLQVTQQYMENVYMENVSIFEDPTDLRHMPELHHHNLKSVKIVEFCSAKSLVELTCHVLDCVTSLECLTLEAPQSCFRCSDPSNGSGKCLPMPEYVLMEAHRATLAIKKYIEPKVPSIVKLHVLEPCRCHGSEHKHNV